MGAPASERPRHDDTLLVVTIKRAEDFARHMPDPIVVQDTFFKSVSRLRHKPDLLRFRLEAPTIAEVLAANADRLTWDECCYARARELLELTGQAPLYVSWSGGIDSTCMLAALLRVADKRARRRIIAVYSHHSVLENPTFFASHVTGLRRRNVMRGLSAKLVEEGGLFVTGELGDQLFGSDILMLGCEKFGEGVIKSPYAESAAKVIEANTRVPGSGRAIYERFLPIVDECPFPIRTTHDFFWWLNFTQKWQYVKFRHVEQASWDLRAEYGSHVVHFYDSLEFQTWSLHNQHLKIKDTWLSYKWAAKDFLHRITGDDKQLGLLKIQSVEKTYLASENRVAVTTARKPVPSASELATYAIRH